MSFHTKEQDNSIIIMNKIMMLIIIEWHGKSIIIECNLNCMLDDMLGNGG